MKRTLLAACVLFAAIWSLPGFASGIGVVNMQTIFRSSPQVKKINTTLQKRFAARKTNIVAMGKKLQTEVKQFQKNQTVMDSKAAQALRAKIGEQGTKLRQMQGKFQRDLMVAQNAEMKKFMTRVKGIVGKIAAKKKLDVVLPSNAVLYSKTKSDITSEVLSALE